jgi:hypothetical protein
MSDNPSPIFNDHNVYVLGAGFSREAGLPLIADFTMKMRDALPWFQSQARDPEAEAIRSVLDFRRRAASAAERVPLDLENIEEIFSLAAATGDASLNRNIASAIAATLDFTRTSAPEPESRVLLDATVQSPVAWRKEGQAVRGSQRTDAIYFAPKYDLYALTMAGFVDERPADRGDAIITFNYDTLIEEGLARLNVPFSYGFEAELPDFHPSAQCIQVASSAKPDAIPVLKLHGSVNWATVAENKRLSVFGTYEEVRGQKLSPLLVPPTWRKDPAVQLSNVWDGAVSALRSATNVIIIGYSIPPTDQHFKYLLAAGLRDNISLRKVYFINPEAAALEKRIGTVLRRGLPVVALIERDTNSTLSAMDFLLRINRCPSWTTGRWSLG